MALPFTVRSFCSRNFARVRDKVSLTVPNSAASTRLAIVEFNPGQAGRFADSGIV